MARFNYDRAAWVILLSILLLVLLGASIYHVGPQPTRTPGSLVIEPGTNVQAWCAEQANKSKECTGNCTCPKGENC